MSRKRKPDDTHDDESTPTELWVDRGEPPAEPPAKPHAKHSAKHPAEPHTSYRTLTVSGQPVLGDLRTDHPEVFELKLAHSGPYSIIAQRIGGAGGVYVEVHSGAYPAPVPIKQVNSVIGQMTAGVFYVTISPIHPTQDQDRFSLACRRNSAR